MNGLYSVCTPSLGGQKSAGSTQNNHSSFGQIVNVASILQITTGNEMHSVTDFIVAGHQPDTCSKFQNSNTIGSGSKPAKLDYDGLFTNDE